MEAHLMPLLFSVFIGSNFCQVLKATGNFEANRIFYLSMPQEALLDVVSSIADNAQTQRGWSYIIIEKPFGFDATSSFQLTQSLLSKYKENQIYWHASRSAPRTQ